MKKILVSLLFIVAITSCKKEEKPVEKTYTVEYKLTCTPLANTSLSGPITYISKTSAAASGTLSNNQWTVTEQSWSLKAGDKIGFKASIANLASYQSTLTIDGGVRVLQSGSQTFPITTNIFLDYTIE